MLQTNSYMYLDLCNGIKFVMRVLTQWCLQRMSRLLTPSHGMYVRIVVINPIVVLVWPSIKFNFYLMFSHIIYCCNSNEHWHSFIYTLQLHAATEPTARALFKCSRWCSYCLGLFEVSLPAESLTSSFTVI